MKLIQSKDKDNSKEKILSYSQMSSKDILAHFKNTENGYSSSKANRILERKGLNQINNEQQETNIELLISAFFNPFSLLLLFIILVSFFTDVILVDNNNYSTIIILSVIIVISGLLHFIQDFRSKKSLENLQKIVVNTTAIIRDGKVSEYSITSVVEGDIIKISAGDMIPADARILSCKDLFLSQSALTGESEPVEKFDKKVNDTDTILELSNICFMGTNVVSGSATAIIIGTGENTYLSQMSKTIVRKREQTAFDKGINKVSWLLIRITFVMVPTVFIINAITKDNLLTSLIFAITMVVGITPELLPMIVASNLAKGSVSMAKKKTIVKNINSIQNLGAIDVLCTDKTGTLTEDNIILDEYLDIHGKEDMEVLKYAYLNSNFQTSLKNVLDIAIINRAKEDNLEPILKDYKKIDEIPFDFSRRRMSIILERKDGEKTLITKGAAEEILAVSSFVLDNGKIINITDYIKKEILETSKLLNKKGLRVIAIAKKNNKIDKTKRFEIQDESDMIMIGFISFLDPPKATAREAIKSLYKYGVGIKVITGDNELVAKKICSQIGINTDYCLTGNDIDNMSSEALSKQVEKTTLFSKISPIQKAEIVKILQQNGHVVGYMGDGINDAPALIQADIGISVDTGVDIAKESSDIILLEKSLLVLQQGIVEGRKVFANIMKYLNMAISSNVGNMVSVIAASLFIPFLPLLPIQILVQNLLYDISQTSIPFDNVDSEYLQKPRKWETKNISKFMFWFAPISSLFDLFTFGVLWFIIGANTIGNQALFQTGWFVMGLISQTVIVYIIRTSKVPFFKSKMSHILLFNTLMVIIVGLILPQTKIGVYIGLVNLPWLYFVMLVLIMALYIVLTEQVKKIYVKKYKEWL